MYIYIYIDRHFLCGSNCKTHANIDGPLPSRAMQCVGLSGSKVAEVCSSTNKPSNKFVKTKTGAKKECKFYGFYVLSPYMASSAILIRCYMHTSG